MCLAGMLETHKNDLSATADRLNCALISGSSKHGKTLPCQLLVFTRSISDPYLSGVCGFHVRRRNTVLDLIHRVCRLVEAF